MSGICGLIDPSGPDPGAVAAAASCESWRGTPVVRADGPAVIGCYSRNGGDKASIVETADSITVADARIDALTQGSLDSTGDAARFDRVMRLGNDGLDDIVGDFAVARYERASGTLTLSRDAIGMRALYWARRGARVGFASDASVLVRLGLASGVIDREAVTEFLAYRNPPRGASGLEGIRRIIGGESLSISASRTERSVRWFRPEESTEELRTPREFADALKTALVEAVTARSRGRRVGLLLSAGRDSGSIAVALAVAGIRATCVTFLYPPQFGCGEGDYARELARVLGHDWVGIDAPLLVNTEELFQAARSRSSPLDVSVHQHALLLGRAVTESGAEVLFDGMGGEPLFVAAPVSVGELARTGRLRLAAAAARAYHNEWTYPYRLQVKAAIRGALPAWALRIRERFRRAPAWVVGVRPGTLDPTTAPRRARDHLVSAVADLGAANHGEMLGGPTERAGAERGCPLADKRIVSLALSLPLELRLPVPRPKPLLGLAFLGDLDATRTKADFAPLYTYWAKALDEALPSWFGPDGETAQLGLVDASRPRSYGEGSGSGAVFTWAAVEAWLRTHPDAGGR